jgi:hypothetical protein
MSGASIQADWIGAPFIRGESGNSVYPAADAPD